MSDAITNATDNNFEQEVLNAEGAVLVDFWAPWCGPCKMIAPILDEVAGNYAGKLKVVKVNVDESQEIPAKYGVRGIPTLAIFKGGQVAGTKVGALSKPQLEEFINDTI